MPSLKNRIFPIVFRKGAFLLSFLCFIVIATALGQTNGRVLDIPLEDPTGISIEGAHGFIEISGIKGLQVTSLNAKLLLKPTY